MKSQFRAASAVIIIALTVLMTSCSLPGKISQSSQSVAKLSDTVRLKDGSVVYSLPRTVFTVRVGFERKSMIPGPYALYAADLLGLKDVIKNHEEHWSVKSVAVSSHEEADPSEYYVIHSQNIFASNVLMLKEEGLIMDLNPVNNHRDESLIADREINANRFMSADLGSDEYYLVETDTAFRRVKVDSTFIRIPYTVEKKKILTADQLAEKAAKRLMEIRDGKVMILTGEANVYPQNDAPINEINKMEKEYTELFTGKVLTETCWFTCQVIPDKESAGNEVTLFRLSEKDGPLPSSANNGIPVIAAIVPEQKTRDITIIESNPEASKMPASDKLFYRIPDVAAVKISIQGVVLYNSRKLVYQYGEVMQLPSNYLIFPKNSF